MTNDKVRCRCPGCGKLFATLLAALGRAKCPQCRTVLVADNAREPAAAFSRLRSFVPLGIALGIIGFSLTIFFAYTFWVASTVDRSAPVQERSVAAAVPRKRVEASRPLFVVDERLNDVHFGDWQPEHAWNQWGMGLIVQASLHSESRALNSHDFAVMEYDTRGQKLKQTFLDFPPLQVGEVGRAEILLDGDAAKVVIVPSASALAEEKRQREAEEAVRAAQAQRAEEEAKEAKKEKELERRRLEQQERIRQANESRRAAQERRRQEEAGAALRYQAAQQMEALERKAKGKMKGALSQLDRGFRRESLQALQRIAADYPDTPTGRQAQALVDKMTSEEKK